MFDCGFSFYKYINNSYMHGSFCNYNIFDTMAKFSLFSNFMNMSFMHQAPPICTMPVYKPPTIFQMPQGQTDYLILPARMNSPASFEYKQPDLYDMFMSLYKSPTMHNYSVNSISSKRSSSSRTGKVLSKTEIVDLACEIARKHGVDERLVLAVIDKESNFKNNLVSSAGAEGLMQLMPGTAKNFGVTDPMDPRQNIDGGVRLLKYLLNKYNGNVAYALAAYNWGEGNLDKYLAGKKSMSAETKNYMKLADNYKNYSVA